MGWGGVGWGGAAKDMFLELGHTYFLCARYPSQRAGCIGSKCHIAGIRKVLVHYTANKLATRDEICKRFRFSCFCVFHHCQWFYIVSNGSRGPYGDVRKADIFVFFKFRGAWIGLQSLSFWPGLSEDRRYLYFRLIFTYYPKNISTETDNISPTFLLTIMGLITFDINLFCATMQVFSKQDIKSSLPQIFGIILNNVSSFAQTTLQWFRQLGSPHFQCPNKEPHNDLGVLGLVSTIGEDQKALC